MQKKFELYSILPNKSIELPKENTKSHLNISKNASMFNTTVDVKNKSINISMRKTSSTSGDRYIPNRSAMNFDVCKFYTSKGPDKTTNDNTDTNEKLEYHNSITNNLIGKNKDSKILTFGKKMPLPAINSKNDVAFVANKSKGKSSHRNILQHADKILDAPNLISDYYLNIMDWSVKNILAVCLGTTVYLWNYDSQTTTILTDFVNNSNDYPSSIKWSHDGKFIVIGTFSHNVEIWSVEKEMKLRTMKGHAARVGSLSWKEHILSSGSKSGYIHHHDVRISEHILGKWAAHSQEVCGLAWSNGSNKCLASGSNDNALKLWSYDSISTNFEMNGNKYYTGGPIHTLTEHKAAVKAIAWCPWQNSILASGAGTADKCIKIWNSTTGECVKSVDTNSQVCNILWCEEYRELASSHGFKQNQITLWKYPLMTKVADLLGHTGRVLHMSLSADKTTIASVGADETLRFWKCFPEREKSVKLTKRSAHTNNMFGLSRLKISHSIKEKNTIFGIYPQAIWKSPDENIFKLCFSNAKIPHIHRANRNAKIKFVISPQILNENMFHLKINQSSIFTNIYKERDNHKNKKLGRIGRSVNFFTGDAHITNIHSVKTVINASFNSTGCNNIYVKFFTKINNNNINLSFRPLNVKLNQLFMLTIFVRKNAIITDKHYKSSIDKIKLILATPPEPKHTRKRRHLPNSQSGDCELHYINVNFYEIGWHWIVDPPSYQSNYCQGMCNYPLPQKTNNSNHAMVQVLQHALRPNLIPAPCCVPTKLKPIDILYMDPYYRVMLKRFDEMIVTKCGCQ
ncbi:Activator of meiotic APC/C protein 1 [Intoshia linei]|uniref:Activator of meiotic APC/C protein 1 n=1 Tax=Intoshia linei TaxID=1819745 RepID=A0A177BBW3_9BILA|nr:Activator of meiotic APC/C protein 1 [Intoshia linei]